MIRLGFSSVKRRLLFIPSYEVSFQTRGFRPTNEIAQGHLESVGRFFLDGYHLALNDGPLDVLCTELCSIESRYRGFAFEGAAMASWLLDSLSFRRHRWHALWERASNHQPYVLHVGVGWALARLPWFRRSPERVIRRFDPFLQWLVIDGFGFHEGYFGVSRWIRDPRNHPSLSAHGNRVFDQGLGRSLWFVEGSDVVRIAETIAAFEGRRQPDLWGGVGLACAYAGRATVPELEFLMASAGGSLSHLQQGVTFGAEARVRGGIADEYTDRTCIVICGMNAKSAAQLTQTSRLDLASTSESSDLPLYEQWRQRIREKLCEGVPTCA